MQTKTGFETFVARTTFTYLSRIKRLKFIYSAIEKYTNVNNKHIKDLRILEVGCGLGGITLPLTTLGCQVMAFDVDEDSVEFVQGLTNQHRLDNLQVTVGDGYTFNDNKTYDVVIASEVFEHLHDPLKFAANIIERMAEGAYLIVTTPNGYGPWEWSNYVNPRTYFRKSNQLRHYLGKPPYNKNDPKYHRQFYTKNRLVRLCSELSLRLIDFEKSDGLLAALGPFYKRSNLLQKIDTEFVNFLPYWLASGWYFTFQLDHKPLRK